MANSETRKIPDPSSVPAPIPVVVIGGYLGAGKTTLVNHLLRHAQGRRLAVLVNEFGALPIDADLIEARDENVISISGGCVCCSYGNDMAAALDDLAEMNPRPELVLLEASGVALPGAIRDLLGLLQDYVHNGVVVLADIETIRQRAVDTYMSDTILRQLDEADLLVLNKVDLVDEQTCAVTKAWLSDLAPLAEIIPTSQARLPLQVISGLQPRAGDTRHHHHDTEAGYVTESFDVSGPVDADALAQTLAGLNLLRAKGFVQDHNGLLMAIQVVGRRFEVTEAQEGTDTGLVCIGLRDRADMDAIRDRVIGPALRTPLPAHPSVSAT